MARATIPNGYLKSVGTTLNDCSTYGDWTHAGTGDASLVSANTEYVKHGTASIMFWQETLAQTGYRFETIQNVSWDASKALAIYVSCFVPYSSGMPSTVGTCNIYLSNDTNLASNRVYANFPNGVLGAGWNLVQIPRAKFTSAGGSFSWASAIQSARLEVHCSATYLQRIVFDAIIINRKSRAKVLITFDDDRDGAYERAFSYTNPRNVRMSHFVIPASFGTAGYCTLAQVQEMYAAGDAVALHDSTSWDDGSETRVPLRQVEMENNKLVKSKQFAAWPGGAFGQNTSSIEATLAGVSSAGVVGARCADADGTVFHPYNSNQNFLTLPICLALDSGTNLATALSIVNEVLIDGGTLIIMGHDIEAAAGSLTWATADFEDLIDKLVSYRTLGLIDIETIHDWYYRINSGRVQIS
jgi:hypothetical protein